MRMLKGCTCWQVSEERFWPVHEAMVRQLKNANLQPERQATYLRLQAIKHFWDNDSVLAALLALTPASLQVLPACKLRICSLAQTHLQVFSCGH